MRVIELENISFKYGNEEALRDISLVVPSGDFLALLGPNGSGKTTLLKVMLGALQPLSGKAKLFETDVNEFKQWDKIGFVPQHSFALDANFPATVREVVSTGLYSAKGLFTHLTQTDWEKVDKVIADSNLQEYADKQIGTLSGGQQQRAFIARALVNSPKLLVLDEPTASIDEVSEKNLFENLAELNKKGVTIIIVSHDIGLVSRKVKTILCMDRHTIFHGASKKFREIVAKKPAFMFSGRMPVLHHHHESNG